MLNKKIVAVIPARMAASRFPGKPLAKILDLPMIEHVRRRVHLCEIIDEVYVATCDQEIAEVVRGFGGKIIMTAPTHQRCTDRVEEAARNIDCDIVLIFQGDEPLFIPEVTGKLIDPILKDESVLCTNLLSVIKHEEDLSDQDVIKTVLNCKNQIMYFSRSSIPYLRVRNQSLWYRQTGLSAFKKEFLELFARLSATPLEISESIDFLRILEHGFPMTGVIYDNRTVGVDRPDDIKIVEEILQTNPSQRELYQKITEIKSQVQ